MIYSARVKLFNLKSHTALGYSMDHELCTLPVLVARSKLGGHLMQLHQPIKHGSVHAMDHRAGHLLW